VEMSLKHGAPETQQTKIVDLRAQKVRDIQSNPLGRPRMTGAIAHLPEEYVFGKTHPTDVFGAGKCIRGDYEPHQQLPDRDLGKSSVDPRKKHKVPFGDAHTFGVPSIRADIAPPKTKSIADGSNYGDDPEGRTVIYPSAHAHKGVGATDFLRERSPEEVRLVFAKMGAEFSDEEFSDLCSAAARDYGALSVDSFRHAWNAARQAGAAS